MSNTVQKPEPRSVGYLGDLYSEGFVERNEFKHYRYELDREPWRGTGEVVPIHSYAPKLV